MALNNWYTLSGADRDSLASGPNAFSYENAVGSVLYQQTFNVSFTSNGETTTQAPFVFSIPYIPGAAKIVIKYNDVVLAHKSVSTDAPVVNVIAPNGGERLSREAAIEWSGSDVDGDQLMYVVLISSDQGLSWEPLTGELTQTRYTWDTCRLPPGTQYLIKVVATDGINTVQDTSNATFTILAGSRSPMQTGARWLDVRPASYSIG